MTASKPTWPRRVLLVRHGESAANVAHALATKRNEFYLGLDVRDMDVDLSPLGQDQSRALGLWLGRQPLHERPSKVLVSPYLRAKETARLILESAQMVPTDFVVDERLREREFGLISGRTKKGIEQDYPAEAKSYAELGKFYYRPPGGESWCDVILRLRNFTDTLSRDYADECVMIVAHSVVVHCFRYLFDHLSEEQILAIDREAVLANSSVTTYIRDPLHDQLTLRFFNSTTHLTSQNATITNEREPNAEKK